MQKSQNHIPKSRKITQNIIGQVNTCENFMFYDKNHKLETQVVFTDHAYYIT